MPLLCTPCVRAQIVGGLQLAQFCSDGAAIGPLRIAASSAQRTRANLTDTRTFPQHGQKKHAETTQSQRSATRSTHAASAQMLMPHDRSTRQHTHNRLDASLMHVDRPTQQITATRPSPPAAFLPCSPSLSELDSRISYDAPGFCLPCYFYRIFLSVDFARFGSATRLRFSHIRSIRGESIAAALHRDMQSRTSGLVPPLRA